MKVGHDVELFVERHEIGNHKVFAGQDIINDILDTTTLEKNSMELKPDNIMLEINCAPVDVGDLTVDFKRQEQTLCFVLRNNIVTGHPHAYFGASQSHQVHVPHLKEHPLFNEFNCHPYYNIWTDKERTANTKKLGDYRLSGGHIHFETNNPEVVKILDSTLGLMEVARYMDTLSLRKEVGYGQAGSCRIREHPEPDKSGYEYIVEYRSLSSLWWGQVPFMKSIQQILTKLDTSEEFVETGLKFCNVHGKKIIKAINKTDSEQCMVLLSEFLKVQSKNKIENWAVNQRLERLTSLPEL